MKEQERISIIMCLYHPTAKQSHEEVAMARQAIRTGNNMLVTLHLEEIIQRTITIKRNLILALARHGTI